MTQIPTLAVASLLLAGAAHAAVVSSTSYDMTNGDGGTFT